MEQASTSCVVAHIDRPNLVRLFIQYFKSNFVLFLLYLFQVWTTLYKSPLLLTDGADVKRNRHPLSVWVKCHH